MHDFAPITPDDEGAVLALNERHVTELSPLDAGRLRWLLGMAYYARMTPDASAFLIALTPRAAYDSPNFGWFRARFDGFVYVDRIVVNVADRGRGIARALYTDVMARAIADGFRAVCCEVNVDPPNPLSDVFHLALGFAEVGRGAIPGGKTVRYMRKSLTSESSRYPGGS